MHDESDREKGFTVRDRRTSKAPEEPPGPREVGGTGEESRDGAPAPKQEQEPLDQQHATGVPSDARVDFSTFLLSLLSSVLIQLGDMPDPITGKVHKDLASAKHTIDILDILKDKTKGNLDEEEDRLLRNATAELKWKYLDAIKKNG